jgi:hypothetical protein
MIVFMSLVDGTEWVEEDAYYLSDESLLWNYNNTGYNKH